MPREIWNEGRVVGYSAYEIYVKQHLAEDPSSPPASERQWLASSLAMGTSMLLKIPAMSQAEDAHGIKDIKLPANSKLAAANTIIASFFEGDAEFDSNGWGIRVTDYGPLISNNATKSPSGSVTAAQINTTKVPTQTIAEWSQDQKNKSRHRYGQK